MILGFHWTFTRQRRDRFLLIACGILGLKEFLFQIVGSEALKLSLENSARLLEVNAHLNLLAAILLFGGFFLGSDDEGWLWRVFKTSVLAFTAFIYAFIICGLIGSFSCCQLLQDIAIWWQRLFIIGTAIYIIKVRPKSQMSLLFAYGLWGVLLLFTNLSEYTKENIQLGLYLVLCSIFFRKLMNCFYSMLENNKRYLKEKETTLIFLEKINTALHSSFNLEEVLKMIMNCIMAGSQAEAGAIFLLSEDKTYLSVEVVEGLFPPLHKSTSNYADTKAKYIVEKFKTDKIKAGEGLVGEVALKGESVLIKNARKDKRTPEVGSSFMKINTMVVAPLKIEDDIVGVIALVNKKDNTQFDEIDDSLLRALGSQAAVSINNARLYNELTDKERMERELQIAKDIQKILLPEKPPEIKGVDLAAFCCSAKEVGGDYYDFIVIDEDHLGIVIADVSGKGVPGALVMTMFRSTLKTAAAGNISAKETLIEVNTLISDSMKSDMFISVYYAVLNLKDKTLKYCRAGHDPLILKHRDSAQKCEFLSPGGICLGLVDKDLFSDNLEEKTRTLVQGDTVFLYTDGATEAMNAREDEFGFENVVRAVQEKGDTSAQVLLDNVIARIEEFVDGAVQHDDLTMLAVKIK